MGCWVLATSGESPDPRRSLKDNEIKPNTDEPGYFQPYGDDDLGWV